MIRLEIYYRIRDTSLVAIGIGNTAPHPNLTMHISWQSHRNVFRKSKRNGLKFTTRPLKANVLISLPLVLLPREKILLYLMHILSLSPIALQVITNKFLWVNFLTAVDAV